MKIAIITGASSGMGRESTVQLADRFGGKLDEIWLLARRKEKMEELIGQVPAKLRLFPMDITDRIQLEKLKLALEEEKPRVVFLVNAAGFGKIGKVGEVSLSDEMGMVQLNCQALCAVTNIVLPYLQPGYPVCFFGSFSSAGGVCHLRGDKILCFKLQSGIKPGITGTGNPCHGGLSGAGGYRVFCGCRNHRGNTGI